MGFAAFEDFNVAVDFALLLTTAFDLKDLLFTAADVVTPGFVVSELSI
jgi:hypothetical protein